MAVPVEIALLALTALEVMVTAVSNVPSTASDAWAGLKLHIMPTGCPEQLSVALLLFQFPAIESAPSLLKKSSHK